MGDDACPGEVESGQPGNPPGSPLYYCGRGGGGEGRGFSYLLESRKTYLAGSHVLRSWPEIGFLKKLNTFPEIWGRSKRGQLWPHPVQLGLMQIYLFILIFKIKQKVECNFYHLYILASFNQICPWKWLRTLIGNDNVHFEVGSLEQAPGNYWIKNMSFPVLGFYLMLSPSIQNETALSRSVSDDVLYSESLSLPILMRIPDVLIETRYEFVHYIHIQKNKF